MSVFTDTSIKKNLNKKFVIYPYDEQACLTPLGYDLRIGYAVTLGENVISYQDNDEITIPAETSVFVISKEHIWFSGEIVGTLHSIGGLSAQGLHINSTTIDPNWSGQLTCLITNTTKNLIKLDVNSKFLTMILHQAKDSTESVPDANPIIVANKYGSIYGKEFSQSLLSYLTSEENRKLQSVFKQTVENAQLENKWFNFILKNIFSTLSIIPKWIKILLIIFLSIITLYCTLLIINWNYFSSIIGIKSAPMEAQIFAAMLAIIITSIIFMISLIKIQKN